MLALSALNAFVNEVHTAGSIRYLQLSCQPKIGIGKQSTRHVSQEKDEILVHRAMSRTKKVQKLEMGSHSDPVLSTTAAAISEGA